MIEEELNFKKKDLWVSKLISVVIAYLEIH